jgi:hypothetical protein
VAVLAGITGHSWDDKLLRPTRFGWATILIAAASMAASIVAAYRDKKKLDWQNSQRVKVRGVAEAELRKALDHLLSPFGILWENAAYGLRLRGKGEEIEGLEFDGERFYRDSEYLIVKLRDPAFREAWSHFDLRRDPEYPPYTPLTLGRSSSLSRPLALMRCLNR